MRFYGELWHCNLLLLVSRCGELWQCNLLLLVSHCGELWQCNLLLLVSHGGELQHCSPLLLVRSYDELQNCTIVRVNFTTVVYCYGEFVCSLIGVILQIMVLCRGKL